MIRLSIGFLKSSFLYRLGVDTKDKPLWRTCFSGCVNIWEERLVIDSVESL